MKNRSVKFISAFLCLLLTLCLAAGMVIPLTANAIETTDDVSGDDSGASTSDELVPLTFSTPENGTVVVGGTDNFSHSNGVWTYYFEPASSYTLTFTPADGYAVETVTVNGQPVTLEGGNTYSGVILAPIELAVTFAGSVKTHTVDLITSNDTGSSVTVKADGTPILGSFSVPHGSTPEITIETQSGFAVSGVTLFNKSTQTLMTIELSGNSFVMPAVTADFELTVKIGRAYFVTVSCGSNGSISPSGGYYAENDTVDLVLTPAEGYVVDSLLINGEPIAISGNTYSYKVTSTTVIYASFRKAAQTYNITVKGDSEAGSITAAGYEIVNGMFTAEQGAKVEFTVTVSSDEYIIDKITVNGAEVSATDGKFTVTVDGDTAVEVSYKAAYRITVVVSDTGGGHVTADGYTISNNFVYVPEGESITFTFTPDMGYEIDYVRVDGKVATLTGDNKYTFTEMNRNHSVSVTFKHSGSSQTTYTIYASAGANGSISPAGKQTVAAGGSIVFTITANEGYEIDYVQVNGSDVSLTNGTYEFKNVASNSTINAYFKEVGSISSGNITVDDIDWTASPIVIDFSTTTVIDKSVFDKILAEAQSVEIVMKSSEFEWRFPAGSFFTLSGTSANMNVIRNGGSNYSVILEQLSQKSITGENCILSCPQTLSMPAGTSLKAYVGAEMARQNVQMYVYKNDELTPVSGLLAVDASGWVTVENYDGGDLVFVRTDVGSYTVAVIAGEHGSVTPNGSITAVMGESVSLNATADEGYIIESIKVDGVEMDLEKGQREYSYTLTVKGNHTVEFSFAEGQEQSGSSNTGLIILIVVIVLVLVGGGVLFYLKWRQSRF